MRLEIFLFVASLWADPLPNIKSLTCTPSSLALGEESTCTIMLSKPAPKGGMAFKVTVNSGEIAIPVLVTVAQGQKTVSFQITRI